MNTERLNRQQRRALRARKEWVPLHRARIVPRTPQQIADSVAQIKEVAPQISEPEIRRMLHRSEAEIEETWKNDQYQVHVIPWPPMNINGRASPVVQLSIRRLDRAPCRDWRDLQRIKNQLVGRECEAIEIYPAESRLVDTATQYHLWCVNDPSFRFPFGYHSGRMVTSTTAGGSVQRPLDDDNEGSER